MAGQCGDGCRGVFGLGEMGGSSGSGDLGHHSRIRPGGRELAVGAQDRGGDGIAVTPALNTGIEQDSNRVARQRLRDGHAAGEFAAVAVISQADPRRTRLVEAGTDVERQQGGRIGDGQYLRGHRQRLAGRGSGGKRAAGEFVAFPADAVFPEPFDDIHPEPTIVGRRVFLEDGSGWRDRVRLVESETPAGA